MLSWPNCGWLSSFWFRCYSFSSSFLYFACWLPGSPFTHPQTSSWSWFPFLPVVFYGYWDSHSATTSGCFTHTWKVPIYWSSLSLFVLIIHMQCMHSNSMQHIAGSPLKGFPHSPLVRFSRTPSPTPTHPQSQRTPLSYKAKLHRWPALTTGNLSIHLVTELHHKTIASHGP